MTEPEWGGPWRDGPTGFEGQAVARTEYLSGRVSLCLTHLDSHGKVEEEWFDAPRLTRLAAGSGRSGTVGF